MFLPLKVLFWHPPKSILMDKVEMIRIIWLAARAISVIEANGNLIDPCVVISVKIRNGNYIV
jgi:hypothetical protein